LYFASREEHLQNVNQIFTFFSLAFSHSIEGQELPIRQSGKYDRVRGERIIVVISQIEELADS
jgi:hypothetical protein